MSLPGETDAPTGARPIAGPAGDFAPAHATSPTARAPRANHPVILRTVIMVFLLERGGQRWPPCRPMVYFCRFIHRQPVQEGSRLMSSGRVLSRRVRSVRPVLVLGVALVGLLLGPLAVGRGDAQEVLTNQSVIGMVKAGFSESVIIAKIRASERKFDTSTDALLKLKAEKVPDKVIEAMLRGGAPAAAAPAQLRRRTP